MNNDEGLQSSKKEETINTLTNLIYNMMSGALLNQEINRIYLGRLFGGIIITSVGIRSGHWPLDELLEQYK